MSTGINLSNYHISPRHFNGRLRTGWETDGSSPYFTVIARILSSMIDWSLMRRSVTSLPLHYGKAPAWLFGRMKELSGAIAALVVEEFGPREFLERIADPIWFQALGCVVGFDWHSSGVTTTLCGALKEGIGHFGDEMPIAICGGKGRTAIRTPQELESYGTRWGIDTDRFVTMSRLCAKVDNNLIQDGYDLYHHVFIISKDGEWAVVQQGMNGEERTARRYQWFSREDLDPTCEPHSGVTCDRTEKVLNLVAGEGEGVRRATLDFIKETPDRMVKTWNDVALKMPDRPYINPADVEQKRLSRIFRTIHESEAVTYKDLLSIKGVGAKTLAALTLVSEIVYDKPPSFRDPARFSFAHGGKDGIPFPVDRNTYDHSISFLKNCLDRAKVNDKDKLNAFRRLSRYEERASH
jgi:hypothetical protein